MPYIDPTLVDDETAVAEAILAALADLMPGFSAQEGHVETSLAEAVGIVVATVAARVKEEARDTFADGFGNNVLRLYRRPAQLATSYATFTVTASGPYTVQAGYGLTLATPSGGTADFATVADGVLANGPGTIHDVPIVALDPGTDANGSVGTPLTRDDLGGVAAVAVTLPAAGGTDEQSSEDYADEVADQALRVRALPITPEDHAALARFVPGVARAIALNRRTPDSDTADAPGHTLVRTWDSAGQPSSGPVVAAVQAALDAAPNLLGTTRHAAPGLMAPFDVRLTVRRAPTVAAPDAQAAAEAAVTTALDPAAYGYDAQAAGLLTPGPTTLTAYDLAALVDDLDQLRGVMSADFGAGNPTASVPATALPDLQTLTVTVVDP